MLENRQETRTEGLRWVAFGAAMAVGITAYATLSAMAPGNSLIAELIGQIKYHVLHPLQDVTVYWLLTIEFGVVLAVVVALQFLMPARSGDKIFSSHVLADGIWFFYAHAMNTFVLVTYVIWGSALFEPHFSSLRLTDLPFRRLDGMAATLRSTSSSFFGRFMLSITRRPNSIVLASAWRGAVLLPRTAGHPE